MKRYTPIAAFLAILMTIASPAAAGTVKVVPRVSGVVESIAVKEGDTVEKGAPLARLDDDLARIEVRKAKAALIAAEARELETRRHLEREQVMTGRGLIPPAELEDAQTAAAKAKGELDLARARLDEAELMLGYTVIGAPVGGRIEKILAHEGQVIRLDVELAPLFEITPAK